MPAIVIDGSSLSIDQLVKVARNDVQVKIDETSLQRTQRARRVLEKLAEEDRAIYGLNTGFGALSDVRISTKDHSILQTNLIRSHATSVGNPHSTETVRAIMLLRANTLLKGNSGVRPEVPRLIISLLNQHVHPYIPEKGSVGASGDLSPLSHMALLLIGEGKAEYHGRWLSGKTALRIAHEKPLRLESKEGLALNNGTQQMLGIGCLCLHDAYELLAAEEAAVALSLEAMTGWVDPFDERIHRARPHPGQIATAAHVKTLLRGSKIVRTVLGHTDGKGKPQDPYSFRCAPQVLGAARDAIDYAGKILGIEMNAATDNPLLFPNDRDFLSGGNFHGQPVAMAMDILALALSNMANISERRISALLDPSLNNGLPPFLVGRESGPGLSSGLMAVQYTAAALVAENKLLAHPASSDSIPTSANFEDFVSMGPGAAQKAVRVLENSQYVVSIELLAAAQGVDLRESKGLARGTRTIYELIRRIVPVLDRDRSTHEDITRIRNLIRSGKISKAVRGLAY